jgi:hypothetical protein
MTSTPLTEPRRAVREGQEIVVPSPDVVVTQRIGVKLVRAGPGG